MPKLITDDQGILGQISKLDIEGKINKYVSYVRPRVNETNVYVAHVFTRTMLEELLSNMDEYSGIRVYIVKEDDASTPPPAGQAVIAMLAVPVVEMGQDFHDQLGDDDKVIYVRCPSIYCKATPLHPFAL